MFKLIDHVSVHVSDVQQSRDFYLRLGFLELERPNFDFDGAWFSIGQSQLHLIEGLDYEVVSGSRKTHFAVSVENMKHFEQYLVDHKIEHKPPRQRPDGQFQIFLSDPDGYWWEFNEA